jgi:hypothetical protein
MSTSPVSSSVPAVELFQDVFVNAARATECDIGADGNPVAGSVQLSDTPLERRVQDLRAVFGTLPPCPISNDVHSLPHVLTSALVSTRVCVAALGAAPTGGVSAHLANNHADIPAGAWRCATRRFQAWLRLFLVENTRSVASASDTSVSGIVFMAVLSLRRVVTDSSRQSTLSSQRLHPETPTWPQTDSSEFREFGDTPPTMSSQVFALCSSLGEACQRNPHKQHYTSNNEHTEVNQNLVGGEGIPGGYTSTVQGERGLIERVVQWRRRLLALENYLEVFLLRPTVLAQWDGRESGPAPSVLESSRNALAANPTLTTRTRALRAMRAALLAAGSRAHVWVSSQLFYMTKTNLVWPSPVSLQATTQIADAFIQSNLQREPDNIVLLDIINAIYGHTMPMFVRERFLQAHPLQTRDAAMITVMNITLDPEAIRLVQMNFNGKKVLEQANNPEHVFRDVVDLSLFSSFMRIRFGVDLRSEYIISGYSWQDKHTDQHGKRCFSRVRRPRISCLLGEWVVISKSALIPCASAREAIGVWLASIWYSFDGTLESGISLCGMREQTVRWGWGGISIGAPEDQPADKDSISRIDAICTTEFGDLSAARNRRATN